MWNICVLYKRNSLLPYTRPQFFFATIQESHELLASKYGKFEESHEKLSSSNEGLLVSHARLKLAHEAISIKVTSYEPHVATSTTFQNAICYIAMC
jgi:hypothetical protein